MAVDRGVIIAKIVQRKPDGILCSVLVKSAGMSILAHLK